jgi:hypothetical protein
VAVQPLAIGPVAARELETALVAAGLAIARPHGHLAVLAKTKSAIAAHPLGLRPVPAAEDLAAVVETTPAPAATEVVAAWEAAE